MEEFVYLFQVSKFKDGNRDIYVSVCKDYNTALCHLIQYIWRNKDDIKGALVPQSVTDKERINVVSLGKGNSKIALQIYPVEKETLRKL